MSKLSENINRAINDFDGCKRGIEHHGITVAPNTPTSAYEDIIKSIVTDSTKVDRVYISKPCEPFEVRDTVDVIGQTGVYALNADTVELRDGFEAINISLFDNTNAGNFEPNEYIVFSGEQGLIRINKYETEYIRDMEDGFKLYKAAIDLTGFKDITAI